MKKTYIRSVTLLLLLSMLLHIAGCGGYTVQAEDLMEGVKAETVSGKEADDAFVQSQMTFSLELFQKTVAANKDSNVLLSPLSVMLALSMTANGAEGETQAQMEEVLGLPIEELNEYLYSYVKSITASDEYKLNVSNSIWFRNQNLAVKPEFLQTNANYYGAGAFGAKFDKNTIKDMNKWISDATDGMIENMVDKIEEGDLMYLINAVLFDAKWKKPYEEVAVRDGVFHALDGREQTVKTMFSEESRYIEDDKAKGFVKPFEGERYSMAILLPNEDTSAHDYVAQLTAEGLQNTLKNITKTVVNTKLPKFSYDFSAEMNDILKGMGMEKAFENDADFSKTGEVEGIDGKSLYINKVVHKTKIQVDELGTVAGASTYVSEKTDSYYPDTKYVYVDRPFVYMIVDNVTNLPIFMGVVTEI